MASTAEGDDCASGYQTAIGTSGTSEVSPAVPAAHAGPDALLAAVGVAAEQFLRADSWDTGLAEVLGAFGRESGATRAFLIRNQVGEDGRVAGRVVNEWTGPGVSPRVGRPGRELLVYHEQGLDRGQSELGQGRLVNRCMSDLPASEGLALERLGVRSALLVPVFLDGEWWGVLGLSERRRERPWTPGEERAMKATAAIVGAALWRARTSDELRRSEERLRRTLENSVYALAAMAEQRDPYTAGHQKRVAELSCEIARDLGLPEEKVEGIRIGALVHDVGKIGIPFELLTKPSLLTEVEFAVVRTHPAVGHSVLKTMDFPWAVADIALQHHEHLDGSGYPAGLCGEAICLEARIVRVADVVEAMACHRPYRPALGLGAALEHISRESGVLYDPGAADACLRLFYEKGFKFSDSPVVQEIPPQH